MMKCLVLSILAMLMAASAPRPGVESRDASNLHKVGLTDADAPAPDSASDSANACGQVSFTRNLKYGDDERNILDVATAPARDRTPRPVLLFVAGENFASDNAASDVANAMQDQAMCFAARHGMVGVRMLYRLAPTNPWPAGARDVAAATSWIHQNIDLFGGNRQEIIAIGYSAGAFHVASYLAHQELQITDSDLAGAILVSGIYRASGDAGDGERAYFGSDPSKYDERSVFPGLLDVDVPIVVAWSAGDPARLITQGKTLKDRLCNSATHCPRVAVLTSKENLAASFGADGPDGLARPTLELVREIEARGLP